MTREDAIKILKAKIDTMEDGAICCNYGNDKEVFEMAIKALEQEPCKDVLMNKPCVSIGVCEHDKTETLDKIREEIEYMNFDYGYFHEHTNTIRKMVLEVIDKYRE